MGIFSSLTRKRPSAAGPPSRSLTLAEHAWSFLNNDGQEVAGRGYLFTDEDGEPLFGPDGHAMTTLSPAMSMGPPDR